MLNKVMLIGRLGSDPEVKEIGGKTLCKFSLATSSRYGGEDHTEWHRVNVWGKAGENAGKYLQKGSVAYVEGKITTREYTDRDGNKRQSTEINSYSITFLDSRKQNAEDKKQQELVTAAKETFGVPKDDDDLPF